MRYAGLNPEVKIEALDPQAGKINFIRGSDPSAWVRGLACYGRLRYHNLYPGIDLIFYAKDSKLEYDFVVEPGADPGAIKLQADDRRPVDVIERGELRVRDDGEVIVHRPLLYQNTDRGKRALEGRFVRLDESTFGFRFGTYDRTKTLVIDPSLNLLYSTFLGGIHDDVAAHLAIDSQGNSYILGHAASEDYPTTSNAVQQLRKRHGYYVYNIVVTKISPSGVLLYSTFLGGSTDDFAIKLHGGGCQDCFAQIALDTDGNAYVTGTTTSGDFPVTANAFQPKYPQGAATAAFLSAISNDGSQLLYSTFFGGAGGAGGGLVSVKNGKVYLSGSASAGLPTTTNALLKSMPAGYYAAYAAIFDLTKSGSAQLVASTYYGSANPISNTTARGNFSLAMAIDNAGNLWLGGETYTNNLPTTSNALLPTISAIKSSCSSGNINSAAFLAKLSGDLSTVLYGTYLSGQTRNTLDECGEWISAITMDGSGNLYLSGGTPSASFPVTPGAFQTVFPAKFITPFVAKLNPSATAITWSTFFGGNGGDSAPRGDILLDAQGNVWIDGYTLGGSTFPITPNAYQRSLNGGSDGFIAELSGDGKTLIYSTYLGGSRDDAVSGMALDKQNNLYISGSTQSADFPHTLNAFQSKFANGDSGYDGSDIFFAILGTGAIGQISPMTAGNAGNVTVTINGAGFQQGATCAIVMGSATVTATTAKVKSDGSQIICVFALNGAKTGSYDVVITNPSGSSVRNPGAFTVTQGHGPQVWINITGRPSIRFHTPTPFYITVGNSGDTDATAVPLVVSIPGGDRAQVVSPILPPPAVANYDPSTIPVTIVNPSTGEQDTPFLIPNIPPGDTTTIEIQIATPQEFNSIAAYTLPPIPPGTDTETEGAPLWKCAHDIAEIVLDEVADQLVKCQKPAFAVYNNAIHLYEAEDIKDGALSFAQLIGAGLQAGIQCGLVANPEILAAEKTINHISEFLAGVAKVKDYYETVKDCSETLIQAADQLKSFLGVGAIDPNDKSGPPGSGANKYVPGNRPLTYHIAFENQPAATAPAAQIQIKDQLDPNLVDLNSISLGSISFGNTTITLPAGTSDYTATQAINSSLSVRIQGSLDIEAATLRWTFTSIDPSTGLPPSDPTIGFLPPNTDGIKGQGSVTFNVLPKHGLVTGTQISNQAAITFDNNAPLNTPVWMNTVDSSLPVSKVQALSSTQIQAAFNVSWSGSDAGSGLRSYSVYISDNGGPYTLFQSAVSVTSATYTGQPGHTYSFYSIATDLAGNIEGPKSTPDTSTTVAGTANSPKLSATTTHQGNFFRGQQSAQYSILVGNTAGAIATGGLVSVTENFPPGLTFASMAGTGWTCIAGQCSRTDALNGGTSYPPITVKVHIDANAPPQVTNAVMVSGGGSATVSASDPTTILRAVAPRDFGATGRSGMLLYDPGLGQSYTALSNGNGTYQYVPNLFTSGFDTLRTGDFNGDGKTDLVLYNSHTALAYIGMGNGDGTFSFQSLFWSPGYNFVESGDLNGDGKTDFALYNSSTGTMYTAISNGTGTFTLQVHADHQRLHIRSSGRLYRRRESRHLPIQRGDRTGQPWRRRWHRRVHLPCALDEPRLQSRRSR